MTRAERISLFAGVSVPVRGALRIDGNEAKFEECWTSTDFETFMPKLEAFAIGLGLSARRFYSDATDEVDARIAADVKLVTERIGWHWTMWHVEAKGRA